MYKTIATAYDEPVQATHSYQIVPKAAERDLFRRLTYTEFCILTTLDIQMRYFIACRLRKEIQAGFRYLLIKPNDYSFPGDYIPGKPNYATKI